jgi:hypothetical protein
LISVESSLSLSHPVTTNKAFAQIINLEGKTVLDIFNDIKTLLKFSGKKIDQSISDHFEKTYFKFNFNKEYLIKFNLLEIIAIADHDMAKMIDSINFTMQFKETVRRFRREIPADSPAIAVIGEVERGMSSLIVVVNEVHKDSPAFCSLEAWARRDLDNKIYEKRWCEEDGEFEVIKKSLNAIRTRLEKRELYEDCAKVRDTTKELGFTKLLELIEKR